MGESDILLEDLLHLESLGATRVKVKFNLYNGSEDPLKVWLDNKELVNKQWLFWHVSRRYFREGDIAVCLVRIGGDLWLLTTVQRVTKVLDVVNGIGYEGEEISELAKFFGRVVVRYRKSLRQNGLHYERVVGDLVVHEILPSDYEDDAFPGYDSVSIDYPKLKRILDVKNGKADWIAALEHQKAVYLITDTSNGRLYVGSATGDNGMLLGRWRNYADDGHGGNKELKSLVGSKGIDHVRTYFRYSILENYNARTEDDYVLARESWWKSVLDSRRHGYNAN